MFFGAATAFIWWGLIEYIQSELGISDADLISNPYILMERRDFKIDLGQPPNESAVYFYFEYDPRNPHPVAKITGPLCGLHHRPMTYEGPNAEGRQIWGCINPDKKKERHVTALNCDTVDGARLAATEATRLLHAELEGAVLRTIR